MIDKFINFLIFFVGFCLVIYLIVKSIKDVLDGGYYFVVWDIVVFVSGYFWRLIVGWFMVDSLIVFCLVDVYKNVEVFILFVE